MKKCLVKINTYDDSYLKKQQSDSCENFKFQTLPS